jgi:SPP1 gp7 family putative phage head morphogenesis protein
MILGAHVVARVLAKVRKRSTYRHVHAAADAQLPAVKALFLSAFEKGHAVLSHEKLSSLLVKEDHAGLMLAVDKAITATANALHGEKLPALLLATMSESGEAAARRLPKVRASADPKVAPTEFAFDVTDQHAVDWARKHAAELVQGVSKASRDEIRELVETTFEEQISVDDLADEIERVVGDEARAESIARTETIAASNRGQQEAWSQATSAGLLTGDEQQEWITTPDDRLCPVCESMDGQVVGLDESFTDDEGNAYDGPPAHPNCRCALGLVMGRSAMRAAYSDDEPRDEHGKWTTGGPGSATGKAKMSARAQRAIASHKPSTAAKQRHAESNETDVKSMVGGDTTGDNEAMDVVTKIAGTKHGVEVKTLLDNSNDKITMHPPSRRRKEAWAKSNRAVVHTVVLDDRKGRANSGHRLYYKRGVGAFRLKGMTKVKNAAHLKQLMTSKEE